MILWFCKSPPLLSTNLPAQSGGFMGFVASLTLHKQHHPFLPACPSGGLYAPHPPTPSPQRLCHSGILLGATRSWSTAPASPPCLSPSCPELGVCGWGSPPPWGLPAGCRGLCWVALQDGQQAGGTAKQQRGVGVRRARLGVFLEFAGFISRCWLGFWLSFLTKMLAIQHCSPHPSLCQCLTESGWHGHKRVPPQDPPSGCRAKPSAFPGHCPFSHALPLFARCNVQVQYFGSISQTVSVASRVFALIQGAR